MRYSKVKYSLSLVILMFLAWCSNISADALPIHPQSGNTLTYTYDAAGRRLSKQQNNQTARHYMDGIEYEGSVLKFVSTPYGRIRKVGNDWIYDYFLYDHLGNVRFRSWRCWRLKKRQHRDLPCHNGRRPRRTRGYVLCQCRRDQS